jgi:hypothetical protein
MGLLEAMACGLKPVIHNFPGANQIFPSEFLFNIAEEFCEQICSVSYEPQKYRRFVEDNFSLKNQLTAINNIFTELETELNSQQTGIPLNNSIQDWNNPEVGQSTEFSAPAFDKNFVV